VFCFEKPLKSPAGRVNFLQDGWKPCRTIRNFAGQQETQQDDHFLLQDSEKLDRTLKKPTGWQKS
jgi:hypothetical protein